MAHLTDADITLLRQSIIDLAVIQRALIDVVPGWHEEENMPLNISSEWWDRSGLLEVMIDNLEWANA
jgi:hypothetical protein